MYGLSKKLLCRKGWLFISLVSILPSALAQASQDRVTQLVHYNPSQQNWGQPQSIDNDFYVMNTITAGPDYAWVTGLSHCPMPNLDVSFAFYNGSNWIAQHCLPWDDTDYKNVHIFPAVPTLGTSAVAWATEDNWNLPGNGSRQNNKLVQSSKTPSNDVPVPFELFAFNGQSWQQSQNYLDGFASVVASNDVALVAGAGYAYIVGRCEPHPNDFVTCYKVSNTKDPNTWTAPLTTSIKDPVFAYTSDAKPATLYLVTASDNDGDGVITACTPTGQCHDIHHFNLDPLAGSFLQDAQTLYVPRSITKTSMTDVYDYSHDNGKTWYSTPVIPFSNTQDNPFFVLNRPIQGVLCLVQYETASITTQNAIYSCINTNIKSAIWTKPITLTLNDADTVQSITTSSGFIVAESGSGQGNDMATIWRYTLVSGAFTNLQVPVARLSSTFPLLRIIGQAGDTLLTCGVTNGAVTLDQYAQDQWNQVKYPQFNDACRLSRAINYQILTSDANVWAYW